MEWQHHGGASYTNWVYGEPDATQAQYPGSTCAYFSAGAETASGEWSATYCRDTKESFKNGVQETIQNFCNF